MPPVGFVDEILRWAKSVVRERLKILQGGGVIRAMLASGKVRVEACFRATW